MRLTSLRSKIFLLVGLSLVSSAVAILLITEHNVTRTVITSEKQSVENVLKLLMRDSNGRWGDWLNNKITTVRNNRAQLVQSGNIIGSVLNLYANQVKQRQLSGRRARELAKHWINHLDIGSGQHSFVFDRSLKVFASDRAALRGVDLGQMRDFKGRDLAATAYREARTTGHSFAIYHRQAKNEKQGELRFAYFVYFQPWDWVFAVSGDGRDVAHQLQTRRKEMRHSISDALEHMHLAQSGFVFIAADNGDFISPPPDKHSGILGWRDTSNGKTLQQMLRSIPPGGKISTFQFKGGKKNTPWEISAAYFKPLGWTIAAAVPQADLTRPATTLRNYLLLIFLLALLISLAVAWFWSARLARPIHDLSTFARKLPEQDLSAPANIPAHIQDLPRTHPDEVGRLAETFIYMDQQLREKIASLVQETSSRERFESELNIAHAIQMGLLPVPLPPETQEKADLHASMVPAKQVGGDLYDYFLLPDGRLCLAIGDVSGKGVPAALFMAITRTLIRSSAEDEDDPAPLVERVNNRLSENNPNMMFVTLIVAVLNLETGQLTWANAGHPPPYIVGIDGRVRRLEDRSGPACGVVDNPSYHPLSTRLEPGEILVGYTDGVTEAQDPEDEQYGENRLQALLDGLAPNNTQELAASLLHNVQQFTRHAEQFDDITLIAVRRISP